VKSTTVLKSREISEVLSRGKVLRGQFLNLYYVLDKEDKIAFLVNRSVRGAVRRNRVRRRIREIWRLQKVSVKSKARICLVAKEMAEKAEFSDLIEDFKKLVKKFNNKY
jgi:ribonuclease P protein component